MPIYAGPPPASQVLEYLGCSVPFVEHADDSHYLVRTRPPRFIAHLVTTADDYSNAIPFAETTGMIVRQWIDEEPSPVELLALLPGIEAELERYIEYGIIEWRRCH